jgi:PIN domain nuclease of toxin-antitoxin system
VKNPIYVLDSFAVLAYFQAEAGGAKVKDIQLITNQDVTPIILI